MNGKRVAVLGGAGFLGSHLCERLLADGAALVVSARQPRHRLGGEPPGPPWATRGSATCVQDICEPFDVEGPLDFVFNLASPASPIDYAQLPLETLRVGSRGTENGLELARRKGAVFFQASTSEVYGDPLEHPQKESYWGNVNPIGPRSVYDEAKRYAEALVAAYRRTHGLPIRIARIFNTYGPRMRLDDGRVVPAFVAQALAGEDFTVFGDGSQTRSFCYVSDLVDGFVRLALSRRAGPGESREPRGDDDPPVRGGGARGGRRRRAHRAPAAPQGRPAAATSGHQPRPGVAGLGATHHLDRRTAGRPSPISVGVPRVGVRPAIRRANP